MTYRGRIEVVLRYRGHILSKFPFLMSYNYSNCTLFGIQNKAERYVYGGWLVFVITCSLLGDTTILVASIRYKAFKLQKIVVAFIQHIAVCDLLITISTTIPKLVSVIKDRNINNRLIPIVSFFILFYEYTVSLHLVSAMTLGKLLSLKYPFKAGTWTTARFHKFCAGIWMAALSAPVLQILIDKEDIVFDCRVHTYAHTYTSSIWKILLPIISLVALFTPNVIIVVSTVLLLKEARRVVTDTRESIRWQGIMTVVLTATVNTIAFLPMTIYFVAEPFIAKDPSVPGPFYKEFYRFSGAVGYLNVLANFFVYSLTVTSFRNFLETKFRQAFSFQSNKVTKGNSFK